MSYADELSVKLTAKDEMSARLRGVKKELESTTRAMVKARQEFETTGSPEAVAELKRLEAEHKRLAKAYKESSDAARKARDDYKAVTDGATKSTTAMGRLGQTITKHAKAIRNAGLVMAGALALVAKSSITAFAEAEKQSLMLQQAYGRFPKINDVTRASFDALNTTLMETTGADDDALAGAEALMARFDLTGKQIQQLMPLVNDYAIATGQDLTAATTTIGKAMLGNAKALKSLGINYKATGDRGKDFTNIMAILADKVGGVGDAFGKSTQGQLEIANQEFQNLKESTGAALVPALQLVVSIMRPLVSFFTSLPNPVKQVGFAAAALSAIIMIATPRIIAMRAAMITAGMGAGRLAGVMRGLGSFLSGPWGIALAVAAAGLMAWMQHMQDAKNRVDSLKGSVDTLTGKLSQAGQQSIAEALIGEIDPAHWKFMDTLGIGLDDALKAIQGSKADMTAFIDKVNASESVLSAQGITAEVVANNVWDWWNATDGARQAAEMLGATLPDTTDAVAENGDAADTAATKVSRLTRAVSRLMGVSSRQQALRDLHKSLTEFGKKKNADNAYSVLDSFNSAFGTYKDGSKAQARFVIRNYDSIVQTIRQSGLSKTLQKQLIDPLVTARQRAEDVMNALMSIDGTNVSIGISGLSSISGYRPMGKPKVQKAAGGAVFGPGTGTSDSIPALLSNGEFVVRAAASKAIGYDVLARLNQADRVPVLPPIVNAPAISLPDGVGRDAPLIGHAEIHTSGQIDLELALAREARRQDRDRRTRMAGTR